MNLSSRSLAVVASLVLAVPAIFCAPSLGQTAGQTTAQSSSRETVKQTLLHQPLHFEANGDGGMSSRGVGRELKISDGGAVIFGGRGKDSVSVLLDGANAHARPVGQGLLPGKSNYMLGNDQAKWRTGVSQFSRVQVSGVYPGVDLVYYGNGDQLEHDYLLAANADPGLIRMKFRGASARLDAKTGELVLQQSEGSEDAVRLERPVAYQVSASGERRPVAADYLLRADGEAQFTLGDYDHARPLVIDPVILYSTYFGGNYADSIVDLKPASDGSLYLLLTTDSTNLTTQAATAGACVGKCGAANADGGGSSTPDMYVVKLDSTLQTVLFATYLGGSSSDQGYNLALDTDGSVYVAGVTQSTDFPIVNGYPGVAAAGGTLTKLSADGSKILYSTLIGNGSGYASNPPPPVMATANNGIVYLIGNGYSSLGFIYKTNALFNVGNYFLAKIDTTQSGKASILYATQVGGSNNATLSSMALDSKGDVWLYGQTTDAAFPVTTTGALQPQCQSSPCKASYIMDINPAGTSVLYATFLGGTQSASDTQILTRDIAIDPSDNVYVSGYYSDENYPTLYGVNLANGGAGGGYISKLSPDGKTLLYSTNLTGPITIGVAAGGQVAFTGLGGSGYSVKNNLPVTPPTGSSFDVIFGVIDTTQTNANSLLSLSYLGAASTNTASTVANRVYLASSGQILLAGATSATNLPVANAYQATPGGSTDGFLTIIQTTGTLTLTPNTLTFPSTTVGSTSAAMTATLFNGTVKSISLVTPKLSDSIDFTQSDNCNGILAPQASCTVTLTFTPQSGGTLTSTYITGDLNNPSNPLTIALSGVATAVPQSETLSPASIDFGTVLAGQTATRTVTFHNNGPSAATIYSYAFSDPAFSAVGSTCTPNLAANASCTFTLQFKPTVAGPPESSTFSIQDRSSNPTVSLTGATYITSPQITLTPNPLKFQAQPQGQATESSFTLTNSSSFTVTFPVGQIVFSDYADFLPIFTFDAGTCYQRNTDLVLAPGTSCQLNMQFNAVNAADTTVTASITLPFAPPGSAPIYAVTGNLSGTTISDAAAAVTPTNIQFPATANGATSAAQTVTVTSTGEQALGFISATLTGANPTAFAVANNCPTSLSQKATCQITVSFSPPANGNEFTGMLDVKLSTGDVTVALAGGTSPSDFILTTPAASQSNPNATWTLNIAPLSTSIGFNEPITFTVTDLDPSYGTPVFTPSTVTPNAATVTTKLTLGQSPHAQLRRDSHSAIPVLACCLVLLLPFRKRLKSYRSQLAVMLVVLALGAFSLTGCESSPVTFTVTATSGAISHNLTLTLQP